MSNPAKHRVIREDRDPVSAAEVAFCESRTAFLLRDIHERTLPFLLANAYHQGLVDAVQVYEHRLIEAPRDRAPIYPADLP